MSYVLLPPCLCLRVLQSEGGPAGSQKGGPAGSPNPPDTQTRRVWWYTASEVNIFPSLLLGTSGSRSKWAPGLKNDAGANVFCCGGGVGVGPPRSAGFEAGGGSSLTWGSSG